MTKTEAKKLKAGSKVHFYCQGRWRSGAVEAVEHPIIKVRNQSKKVYHEYDQTYSADLKLLESAE